ncbi:hypothetical protein [Thalassomonas haliotis]|uniref:Uncharacterized protein n=1 Tax=Thalassomonas haliotis TaxID=485448 RepID=A0ABY7V8X9_9GAMM|nr:hypothetical protein [Thalassomonas haliotis]WDE10100.1 hypothetical protein H3N35_17625 [Thalassomonas haliotis]
MKILKQILDWLFNRQKPKKPTKSGNLSRPPAGRKKQQTSAATASAPGGSGRKKPLTPPRKNSKPVTGKNKAGRQDNSKQNPLRQSKSYQKTLTLLNHVHKEKLLKRVRTRASGHPQLTAAIIKGWLNKNPSRKKKPSK